jgi:hypothetical protein
MPKKTKMLQDLFHDTLKDVYFAEKKILTTLPKMKKAAQSEKPQMTPEEMRPPIFDNLWDRPATNITASPTSE